MTTFHGDDIRDKTLRQIDICLSSCTPASRENVMAMREEYNHVVENGLYTGTYSSYLFYCATYALSVYETEAIDTLKGVSKLPDNVVPFTRTRSNQPE